MVSFSGIPSPSSLFSIYASMSTSITLFKTMVNQLLPYQVQSHIVSVLRYCFRPRSSETVLMIEERDGMTNNELYDAAEIYLNTKISPNIQRLKVSKHPEDLNITVKFSRCSGAIVDSFGGIQLNWTFICEEGGRNCSMRSTTFDGNSDDCSWESEKRYFELSFHSKHKEEVMNSYLPFVVNKANDIKSGKKVVKLHTLACSYSQSAVWDSINLQHPSTFETIAMEPALKKAIVGDLDRFLRRKELYKRVGKAWKRGYLLYGPPGTGKSSLIAAIANYLKFDIYDLELTNIKRNADLRKLLLNTSNRSILVIEDIDCSVELPDRTRALYADGRPLDHQLTLSGLLNFIDGLWSSCGDERIIIFTTNNKDKLDPALLRPGRMDMHIHMSYLTKDGFKVLASNYLNKIHDHCHLQLGKIEEMIEKTNVTPAEVAEELLKSEDAESCLQGLVNFLKRKKIDHQFMDEESNIAKKARRTSCMCCSTANLGEELESKC